MPGNFFAMPRLSERMQGSRWMTIAFAVLAVVLLSVVVVFVVKPRLSGSTSTPSSAASAPSSEASPTATVPPGCSAAEATVNAMSTRDKLAQLLMVGVTGADDARAVATDHHVGGIMIGSWTDLSMLQDGSLRDIAASAGALPLAVSTDEEGGRVSRLATIIGEQPSPRILAATSTPEQVYTIALERGRAMKQLGITVDFAPVVDVTDAPDDTVIGDRSFGSDAETVTAFAGAYARGLRDAGVLPVLKHFPGHGHGSGDSHTGGVVVPPIEQLQTDDLIPYRTLTTEHPVAVMLGHVQVPGLTGTDQASLSKPAYDLLRSGGYGGPPFTGLVYTDDLSSMAAVNQQYTVPEAVLRALQAGADIALWITTDEVPAVLDSLEQAVNSGQLSMDRVNESAMRVADSKSATPNCGR
jgi:beta-N-acetylhexosaminidase